MLPNAPRYLRSRSRRVSTTGPRPTRRSWNESSNALGFCTLCAVTVCVASRNREVGLSAVGASCHAAAEKEEAPGGASIIGRSSLGGVSDVRLGRTARRRGFCAAWTFLTCLNISQRVFPADFRITGICFRLVQASGRRKGRRGAGTGTRACQLRSADPGSCSSNTLPVPSLAGETVMPQPLAWHSCCTIARPRPLPPVDRLREVSSR